MDVVTSPFSPTESESWNEFVTTSNNGTIFHRLDFLDYHPADRFDEHHFQFLYKGQHLMGVMPMAIEDRDGTTIGRSPYGGSYGGIVVDDEIKFRYVERMVEAMVDHLSNLSIDEIVVRSQPREQHRTPSSYVEFHLLNNGFEIVDHEITHVVDLSRFKSDPFDVYEGRCRTAVRKAKEFDVTVERQSNDWDTFYELLIDTYDRHGKEPTHSLNEFRDLHRRFPDSVFLSIARFDGEPIAGQVGFDVDSNTYLHMYNCRSEKHDDRNAVNLLLDTEIRWAKEQGYDFFDLGTSVESFDWNSGLVQFKESFGATGHFRNVYRREM